MKVDWEGLGRSLDAEGHAIIERPAGARGLRRRWPGSMPTTLLFRSRVVMARHGFGRGEYKYLAYPLPPLVARLREAFYPKLVPIANRWHQAMGIDVRFPATHAEFIARCHEAGQARPTPLVLQ